MLQVSDRHALRIFKGTGNDPSWAWYGDADVNLKEATEHCRVNNADEGPTHTLAPRPGHSHVKLSLLS